MTEVAAAEVPWYMHRRRVETIGAFALAILVHFPALLRSRPLDDETYLASMGRMLRSGDTLYRDVIDRKPPLVLWAYQWLLPDNWNMQWVRLVVVVLVALNGLAVVAIARRLGTTTAGARLAGAFAIIGTAFAGYSDAHAANFELWGLLPATLAVLVALGAAPADRSESDGRMPTAWILRLVAAGALVGVATNCKQPYVFTVAAVVLTMPRRRWPVTAAAALTGLFGTTAIIAAIAGWSGYWRWAWFENGDYVRVGILTLTGLAVRQIVVFVAVQWPLTATAWFGRRRALADPYTRRVVGAWLAVALLGVASGMRFFGHYFQQVVPPLAIIAGFALADRPRRGAIRIAVATGYAVALWTLSLIPAISGLEAAPRAVVTGIAAATKPSDRVLVWGRLPDAAVEAKRVPSGRFVHQGYLTGDWAAIRGVDDPAHTDPYAQRWVDYVGGLAEHPPELVVDASSIVKGWERYAMRSLPLQRLVDTCYVPAPSIDGLPTYRWNGRPCSYRPSQR